MYKTKSDIYISSQPGIPTQHLREIMLETHEKSLKDILELPNDSELHYDENSEHICVNGTPLKNAILKRAFDKTYVNKLIQERKKRKNTIIKSINSGSGEDIFHAQFDYEMLGLDHLVNTEKIREIEEQINSPELKNLLLTTSSGRTFFEETNIKELEVYGHSLVKRDGHKNWRDFYFDDKGTLPHFQKHTLTRNKLIYIILKPEIPMEEREERWEKLRNSIPYESALEVYEKIKTKRINQMKHRASRLNAVSKLSEQDRIYAEFVGEALDFNEENRLLRSISFYEANARDSNLGDKFEYLLSVRKKTARKVA